MKYANLHLHSIHSDGLFTPEMLVNAGKSLGYRALALTDHQTDSGVEEMFAAGAREGLDIISGVEFYVREDGREVHMTALDYDRKDQGFRKFVDYWVSEALEHTKRGFDYGVSQGFFHEISWEDALLASPDGAWFNGNTILRAYAAKKIPVPQELREFTFHVFKKGEVIGPRPCATMKDTIEAVRQAGGVIVLAHPLLTQFDLVDKLVGYGMNGIEVCHPDMGEEATFKALQVAKKYNLYHSGGTDHTGALSAVGGKHAVAALQGVTEEEYFTLKERRKG